jgi:PKD repeat protein
MGMLSGCIEEKPKNVKPKADFIVPEKIHVDIIFQFIDNSVDDKKVVSWFWDFGDNTTSNETNPTHKYDRIGEYTVKLTVADEEGLTDTCEKKINVTPKPPQARFDWNPKVNITTDTVITFTDTSEPKGDIVSWEWDFGDNTTSNETNPTHKYNRTGEFIVKLTVTDKHGQTDTYESPVPIRVREAS